MLKRIKHFFNGYPKEEVTWGTLAEGATCKCGAHWTLADYYPFM